MNKHPEIIPIIVVIFVKISFLLQCHLQSIEKKKKNLHFIPPWRQFRRKKN